MKTLKLRRDQLCFRLRPAPGLALFAEPDDEQEDAAEGEAPVAGEETEDEEEQASTALRQFSGIAASGQPFDDEWFGRFALDLEGLTIPDGALAVLRDHDPRSILGFSTSVIPSENGLEVQGQIITTTEQGREVAALADAGFPWQMSVYIPPTLVEEVSEGETAEVNGHTFTGPGVIFRKATLRELTLTATGRDAATSAQFSGAQSEVEVEILERAQTMATKKTDNPKAPAASPTGDQPSGDTQRAQFSEILGMAKETGAPYDLVQQAVDGGFTAEQAKALFSAFALGRDAAGTAEQAGAGEPAGAAASRAAHLAALRTGTSAPSGSAEEEAVYESAQFGAQRRAAPATRTDDMQVLTLEQFSARADLVQEFGEGEDGFATFAAWRKHEARA